VRLGGVEADPNLRRDLRQRSQHTSRGYRRPARHGGGSARRSGIRLLTKTDHAGHNPAPLAP
jgi:hypothetical protein